MHPAPPDLTLPPSFTVRPATLDDLKAAVALFNACSMNQIGTTEYELEDLRAEWQEPNFSFENSTRVIHAPDGQLVGYIEVWDTANPPVHPWVWGRVHPDYENQGLGSYLMAWAEARAHEAIARVPDHARVSIVSGSISTHEPTKRLLEDRGMTLVRHFWRMKVDFTEAPPEAQWPEGITVRTYDHEQDGRAVYLAKEEAFQDHFGHVQQPFEEGFRQWEYGVLNDPEYHPKLRFIAMDGEEIAGILLGRPRSYEDAEMGWVNILAVRRPWRKQGLGMALLLHAFGEFYRRGKTSVGLGVDASSMTGATRIYERAGMVVQRQFDTYEREIRAGEELAAR